MLEPLSYQIQSISISFYFPVFHCTSSALPYLNFAISKNVSCDLVSYVQVDSHCFCYFTRFAAAVLITLLLINRYFHLSPILFLNSSRISCVAAIYALFRSFLCFLQDLAASQVSLIIGLSLLPSHLLATLLSLSSPSFVFHFK